MAKRYPKYKIGAREPDFTASAPEILYFNPSTLDNLFTKIFNLIGFIFPTHPVHHQESDLIPIIRKGLSKKNLDHLMITTGLDLGSMAKILHISERTFHRYTHATTLNPEISERIFEIARLYTKGEEAFGDLSTFKVWMSYPSKALGSKPPKELLDTSMGIKLIEDELVRIEQGIY
ncbi:MAG: antitoxin Xre-like helix-turn-helix domain-containing protein [Saprospiraceae bacterium]